MWQQWVNAVLGLWVIAVPFIGMTGSTFTWAMVITGAVIILLALWGVQETSSEREVGKMVHRMQH
jgi:hypothetical protein